MYTVEHLANIRLYELDRVASYLRKGAKVLEIGAGAGWQAKKLSERGLRVTAIDVASSYYKPDQVWPVIEYDGAHIPFPDNYFDIVFSSNVLEHIPDALIFDVELLSIKPPEPAATVAPGAAAPPTAKNGASCSGRGRSSSPRSPTYQNNLRFTIYD